jgi:hypothetical protein
VNQSRSASSANALNPGVPNLPNSVKATWGLVVELAPLQ